jgi:hypothetical protein
VIAGIKQKPLPRKAVFVLGKGFAGRIGIATDARVLPGFVNMLLQNLVTEIEGIPPPVDGRQRKINLFILRGLSVIVLAGSRRIKEY